MTNRNTTNQAFAPFSDANKSDRSKAGPDIVSKIQNIARILSLNELILLASSLDQIALERILSESNSYTELEKGLTFNRLIPLDKVVDLPKNSQRASHIPRNWKSRDARQSRLEMDLNIAETGSRRMGKQTRFGKKINSETNFDINPDYYNPYECGPRQSRMPSQVLQPYQGSYDQDSELLQRMGIYSEQPIDSNMIDNNLCGDLSSHIRDINVESSLIQKESTRMPGMRILTGNEIDRFESLPFDPQDPKHIVWADNMPRGGYSTRNNRLEYN